VMTRAGLANEIVTPIEPRAWQKLVASLAINPTTALAGVPNGAILTIPALRERAASLAREAAAVARASEIALPFADPVAYAESVMHETAANRSSMLRDLECGRHTEIEAIAGTIVRRAEALGIAVPYARAALHEVRARTKA
jgi:2-dehydropantoate 2-reductase